MASRKSLRKEIRKEAIIEAASRVFAEKGFSGATLDQIGEQVGLSKGSLYYYVNSKEELIANVLEHVLNRRPAHRF
jgi:TetR/AcrR family transcriptional regulator, cholesterol catabolism regulator